MLVKMADKQQRDQIENLREEFAKIDVDGSGVIDAEELREAIDKSEIALAVN